MAGEQAYDKQKRKHGQKIIFCGPIDEEKNTSTPPEWQPLSPSKRDRSLEDKNLSILDPLVEKLLSWTDEQMQEWYPHLFGEGFQSSQIHQIVNDLHTRCRSLDLIIKSLDYAEWELAHGKMVDKEGRVVGKPASYLFTSLKQQGHYRRPQGYVDPLEKALEEEKRRQEDLLKQREAIEEKVFQGWLDSLSDKDKEKL